MRRFGQEKQNEIVRRLEMEDSSKTDGDLVDQVSSLNERLTALEAKVTKLSSKQEQGEGALNLESSTIKLDTFLKK